MRGGATRLGPQRSLHRDGTEFNHEHNDAQITLPYLVDDALIDGLVK